MRREHLLEEVLTDSALSGHCFLKWSAALAGGGFGLLQAVSPSAVPGTPEDRLDSPRVTHG